MMLTNTTTNNHNYNNTADAEDAQLIPAIMAVLGMRERFTPPMANALMRARMALLSLANYDVTPDEIRASIAHTSLSPTVALALVKDAAKTEAIAAEARLREAARLEAAYQDALSLL
jgi:hypothetical protein